MATSPRPVRIGVLGCADIARRRMLPAMAACPDVEVVAVASRDPGQAEETARPYGCRAVCGYEALLADETVDAVYVPLPAALHAEWVEAALQADKHVLAEKPLTLEPARTASLFQLAGERRVALMENVMFVHHHQHDVVRKLVAEGAIGELRSFHSEFTVPRRATDDIRYDPGLGGGALWDTGVYPVRAAMHLLESELEVVGAVLTAHPDFAVDTGGAALLRTRGGVTAHLTFGLDHGYRSSYTICGSRGRITVDRAFTSPAGLRPAIRLETGTEVREPVLAPHDQVAETVAAFARAARAGMSLGRPECLRQAMLLDRLRRTAGSS
ncbi:Gfo/Idh/MocA family protein [Streptomyces sp. 7N604]|uniref:Gfo/Idh/MocA family protein n=1 Tax=Streptomyces sp. 7N604 TaxID=3457415 RepID=UPI003FCEF405